MCYMSAICVLHGRYKDAVSVLRGCNMGVVRALYECYVYGCYTSAIKALYDFHDGAIWVLYKRYKGVA